MKARQLISEVQLETLQRRTFDYFIHEANTANGLVVDETKADWPASIAATGLALTAYPVGVERGFWARSAAVERTLTTLRFFWNSPRGPRPDATGYQGFYYHFLDMQTGRRAWDCELSTVIGIVACGFNVAQIKPLHRNNADHRRRRTTQIAVA